MTVGLAAAVTRPDVVDASPPLVRKRARTSERALVRAYSGSVLPTTHDVRPCACGEVVAVRFTAWTTDYVAHVASAPHQAWRRRHGFVAPEAEATA